MWLTVYAVPLRRLVRYNRARDAMVYRLHLISLIPTFACGLLSASFVHFVHAADTSLDFTADTAEVLKFLAEETVVTASRYEQPISQAPSNVYVITDEDIRQSGATDLPTILRRVPGMEVMQMTAADFNVSMRGDNQTLANKLLVLIDGRSIYLDQEGVVFWKAIPITLPEIKRIEVVKGPTSAVYGFNAFDGVVNIITKSPEELRGTTAQIGGGQFGTWMNSAIHAGTHGRLGYRLSAGEDQAQEWRDRNALGFRSYKANGRAEYGLTDVSKVILEGGFVDVNRFDGIITETVVAPQTFTDGYARAVYERPNFYISSFWRNFHSIGNVMPNPILDSLFAEINPNNNFKANTYDIEAQHRLDPAPFLRVAYGVNYRHNTLSYNFLSQYSIEDRLGVYAQSEWRLGEKFKVDAGVRYDLDSFIKPTISPRIAFIYNPAPDHTFLATLSVAYRPPTATERYNNVGVTTAFRTGLPAPFPPIVSTTALSEGSTNLSPEEIVSYDIGYQGWYLKHRLRLRGNLFFNHISNLIVTPTTSGIASLTFTNGGVADIYGGEAQAEYLFTKWLSGFANFAYEEIGQTLTGSARRGAPRFKANAGLRSEWESGLNAEASFYHVGAATYPLNPAFTVFSQPIPTPGFTIPPQISPSVVPPERVGSYNLLNLRLGYRFWQQKAAAGYLRDAEVAVGAFNALNDRHKEHLLADTIGTRVMGWLTLRL